MQSLNIPYNPRIDQLRWLAATIVFLFHFYTEFQSVGGGKIQSNWFGIISEGHTGVGLFFTLSGFLFMQIALYQRRIAYADFVRNRFLRIFPLFFTIFLLATSIGRDKFLPQDIFTLFTSNLGLAPTSLTVVTGAAWCISLEFMFYMIFPFLARFAMEHGMRYLMRLLALMLFFKLVAYTVNENSNLMYFSTFVGRFDQFLIGMLAALIYQRHTTWLRNNSILLLAAAAAAVFCDCALLAQYAPFGGMKAKSTLWIFWSLIESVGWAAFIVGWLSLGKELPQGVKRILCHGGKISFSFYLLHLGVIHLFAQWFGLTPLTGDARLDIALYLAVLYSATWGIATLSFKTIEEPFLRMRRDYGGRTERQEQITTGMGGPP